MRFSCSHVQTDLAPGASLGEPSRGGGAAAPVVGPVGVGAGIGGWDSEPVSGEGWGRQEPTIRLQNLQK